MGNIRSRERITKPCDNCGNPVTRLKSADAPRFYCDHKCYSSSKRRADRTREIMASRHPNATVTLPCERCGVDVTRVKSRVRGATYCSRSCQYAHRRELGKRFVNSSGYIVVGVPADYPGAKKNGTYGQILEHRKVMQEVIGRPLIGAENVHHINGVRTDNRPENLELWSNSQPSGQRVQEKVQWAREMLALYGDLFPEKE